MYILADQDETVVVQDVTDAEEVDHPLRDVTGINLLKYIRLTFEPKEEFRNFTH